MATAEDQIEKEFAQAHARGFVHVREVGILGGPQVSVRADDQVVLASVFKIAVAIAYAREVADGRLDPAERATITPRYRIGGIGTAGCADDVTMSWRDLARFMLTMSDNAATDTIFHRLGGDAVQRVLDDAGLDRTRLLGCCENVLSSMATELGIPLGSLDDQEGRIAATSPQRIWSLTALDPERTSSSTPREITELLDALWTDRVADQASCAWVRETMGQQIWPQRLSSGFPSSVAVAGKTGTLPGIRNEAGVVTYPDGRQFAVAVFTRARVLDDRQPAIDASIGRVARLAVDYLRGD